jgi:hypothetical protein
MSAPSSSLRCSAQGEGVTIVYDDASPDQHQTVYNFNKDNFNRIIDNNMIKKNQYCTNCNLALNIKNILNSIYSSNSNNSDNNNDDKAKKSVSNINKTTTETSLKAFLDDDTQEKHLIDLIKTKTKDKSVQKIIIISDEYRKKPTENITIVKAKEKLTAKKSRSLENLQIVSMKSQSKVKCVSTGKVSDANDTNNLDLSKNNKNKLKKRALSKSADDLSTSSNEVLENVDSVELIFISDEFLNSAEQPQVFIVTEKMDKKLKKQITDTNNRKMGKKDQKQIIIVSDNFKKKSLKNNTATLQKATTPSSKEKPMLLKNLKTTTTNSNNFLSYEEPDTPLESKTILDKVE